MTEGLSVEDGFLSVEEAMSLRTEIVSMPNRVKQYRVLQKKELPKKVATRFKNLPNTRPTFLDKLKPSQEKLAEEKQKTMQKKVVRTGAYIRTVLPNDFGAGTEWRARIDQRIARRHSIKSVVATEYIGKASGVPEGMQSNSQSLFLFLGPSSWVFQVYLKSAVISSVLAYAGLLVEMTGKALEECTNSIPVKNTATHGPNNNTKIVRADPFSFMVLAFHT